MKIILLLLMICIPFSVSATEKIRIGVTESVPFAIKGTDANGNTHWSGITIQLWEDIADDLDMDYEYVDLPLEDNLSAVADPKGDIDIAVGAMSITASREAILDFSHPYFMSGLGVVTKTESSNALSVYGLGLLKAVGIMMFVIVALGLMFVVIERKHNKEFKNIDDGMWFALVTMTTTGYGDKVPLTRRGRLFAGCIMVVSAIMFPALVGGIVANITIDQYNSKIESVDDLDTSRVGIISGTSAATYLRKNGIAFVEFNSIDDLLMAISKNKVDGGVYDKPMLQYHVKQYSDLSVLSDTFERQYYGFALRDNTNLREDINTEILSKSNSLVWLSTINQYLSR